jgi:pimeloyl-ACP methyl ester carboxylesterase
MANFLLIHGACHGGWCWERVAPLLEAAGHSVAAPDLPGHGDDATPMSELSLERYGAFVAELAVSYGPVVLVGHSMAGAVISRAAEAVPDQIERLVYLTAYLPQSGESLASLRGAIWKH